ncbi:MAG: response regulator, partial [Betaproteobacteria bacterium]|nr:response regulator [Betaproteobacteria bacterium]
MTIVDEKNRGYAPGATDYTGQAGRSRAAVRGVAQHLRRGRPRVLLVDDDDLMRRGMRLALEKDGWEVGLRRR